MTSYQINPELDLVLERTIDVPRELVWQAWTTPEKLMLIQSHHSSQGFKRATIYATNQY